MMKVNPNEAPEGYVAIAEGSCYGCAFDSNCSQANCLPGNRYDACSVIFIKKSPEFMPQHEVDPNFQNELLKSIADDCGFTINNINMQENIK